MTKCDTVVAALAASLFAVGAANAATVGSVTFDSFADQGGVAKGTFTAANILDGSLNTSAKMRSDDTLRFSFSSGGVVNGAGADVYVFEGYSVPENSNLSLTFGGTTLAGTFVESVAGAANNGSAQINTYSFDLSALGIAAGASVGGDLFLTRNSLSPEIFAIGAASTVSAVPLPAAAWMLLAGLGGLGLMGRQKKSG